jgi:hypothetical protein
MRYDSADYDGDQKGGSENIEDEVEQHTTLPKRRKARVPGRVSRPIMVLLDGRDGCCFCGEPKEQRTGAEEQRADNRCGDDQVLHGDLGHEGFHGDLPKRFSTWIIYAQPGPVIAITWNHMEDVMVIT